MEAKLKAGVSSNFYACIHQWLIYHYGKADKCENKKCIGKSKNYEWALKKGGIYKYKRASFIRLCVSCHRKYDITEETRKKKHESSPARKRTHCIHGHLLSGDNVKHTKNISAVDGRAYLSRQCRTCANARLRKYYRNRHALLSDLSGKKQEK